jgi:hypothetical protein
MHLPRKLSPHAALLVSQITKLESKLLGSAISHIDVLNPENLCIRISIDKPDVQKVKPTGRYRATWLSLLNGAKWALNQTVAGPAFDLPFWISSHLNPREGLYRREPVTQYLPYIDSRRAFSKMRLNFSEPPTPTLSRQNTTIQGHHQRRGTHPHRLSSRLKPRR